MAVPSFRAPLLWLLLPMICGYLLGHQLPNVPVAPTLIFASIALLLSFRSVPIREDSSNNTLWAILFISGVSATSLLFYQGHRQYPDLWEHLPAREANLQLKVKRLYASTDDTVVKGIAVVVGTEQHLQQLRKHLIFFSIVTEDHPVNRGQLLKARGVLNYIPAKESLTYFEQYLRGQSVSLVFNRAYLTEPPADGSSLETWIAGLRTKAIRTLGIQLEDYPEERSIYRGMMLGLKSDLSWENKQLFLKTGTLHLFAISGLHVGIIAVTLAGIFLVLRIPRQISVVLGLILVYFYVEITGASPSAVRAFAMTAFFWAGKSLVRQMPPFQALVASAIVVLVFSPTQLFSAGFQLSYTVVSGILLWGVPLYQTLLDFRQSRIKQKQRHLPKYQKWVQKSWETVVGTFCISLSATLASAPLSILYFGLLAPLAVMLNMVLVPVASLMIVSGVFSLISGYVYLPAGSGFFNHGPLVLIQITGAILEWVVRLPGAFIIMDWTNDWMGYVTVCLFLGSLLAVHGMRLPKVWRFTFPVVITSGMIFLNSLIRLT